MVFDEPGDRFLLAPDVRRTSYAELDPTVPVELHIEPGQPTISLSLRRRIEDPDLDRAMADVPSGALTILLSHSPDAVLQFGGRRPPDLVSCRPDCRTTERATKSCGGPLPRRTGFSGSTT